jgi:glycogen(starch) synthase
MSGASVRILYWTPLFHPYIGGVEVQGVEYVRALRSRGHEVAIVTSHGSLDLPDQDVVAGAPVHRFRLADAVERRDPGAILAVERRVGALRRAFAPDLVHLQLTDASVFFHLRTADAHPAPTVVTVAVSPPDRRPSPTSILGRVLRDADWVTASSDAMLARVRLVVPEVEARSSRIYNGLPMPSIAPAPLPFDPPTLLCLGRVVEDKGFDLAIQAFASIRRRVPAARLVVSGDGPARSSLERQASTLGLADSVEFTGWVQPEDVPALLNRTTVVIVPSRWQEAFGLVALQAAQMARPVVATGVGGLPEVVRDGSTGLVVPPESPAALAEAACALLQDLPRARALGLAALARAEREFGFAAHVRAHERLYCQLTGRVSHVAS